MIPCPVMRYMLIAMSASRPDSPQPHANGTAVATAANGTAMNKPSATCSPIPFS